MFRSFLLVILATALVVIEGAAPSSFFDFTLKDIDGNDVPLTHFRNRVTLVVNVASYCGYTDSHYAGLVDLWKEFEPTEGLHILAFPCNQFGKQEPGTSDEIKAFAESKGVTFHMMEKIDVNGPNTSELYKYVKAQAGVDKITWNFATYFLVAKDGVTVHAFSNTEPKDLRTKIIELIGYHVEPYAEEL